MADTHEFQEGNDPRNQGTCVRCGRGEMHIVHMHRPVQADRYDGYDNDVSVAPLAGRTLAALQVLHREFTPGSLAIARAVLMESGACICRGLGYERDCPIHGHDGSEQ